MPEPTDPPSSPSSPFSHFDPEVPVPLSATDIRRRGDRLRRRNTALAAVAGVAAIALIATPIALVGGGGDTAPVAPSTQSSSVSDPAPSTSGPTSPAALTLDDLPSRQRLDAWRGVDPAAEPVLACAPTGYDLPSVAGAFEAAASVDPGGTPIARVRTVVYTFATADAAAGGFAEVSTQLDTCPEFLGISPGQEGDATGLGGDLVDWQRFTYGDPELCTDCDGVYFDHMGVAQVDNRLVLLSYAEAGGPLEPKNMDTFMRDVLAQAISLA